MARREELLDTLEKAYEATRANETEALHNAIGAVLQEHKATIQNALFVLDIIRFELMEAKYKEILGTVQLSDKPPIPIIGKKKE